jgi:hypothetical protein
MRFHNVAPLIAAIPSVLAASPLRPELGNTTALPTHFAMLLIPEFQALDVFGPLDVLNTLSMLYKNVTTMRLSVISRSMDPVATTNRTGKGYFGQDILPTTTMQQILGGGGSLPPAAPVHGPGGGYGTKEGHGTKGGYGMNQGYGTNQGYGIKEGRDTGEAQSSEESQNTHHGQSSGPSSSSSSSYGKRAEQPVPPTDVIEEESLGDVEVLFVPGGGGTRRNMTEEIAFVKDMYPKVILYSSLP